MGGGGEDGVSIERVDRLSGGCSRVEVRIVLGRLMIRAHDTQSPRG